MNYRGDTAFKLILIIRMTDLFKLKYSKSLTLNPSPTLLPTFPEMALLSYVSIDQIIVFFRGFRDYEKLHIVDLVAMST